MGVISEILPYTKDANGTTCSFEHIFREDCVVDIVFSYMGLTSLTKSITTLNINETTSSLPEAVYCVMYRLYTVLKINYVEFNTCIFPSHAQFVDPNPVPSQLLCSNFYEKIPFKANDILYGELPIVNGSTNSNRVYLREEHLQKARIHIRGLTV